MAHPVDFQAPQGSRKIVLAKDQPEYGNLPAAVFPEGAVLTVFAFNPEEIAALLAGEPLMLWIWSFGHPVQPVAVQVSGVYYEDF